MAKDKIHKAIKTALIKDGWIISNDPFYLETGGVKLNIDLGAEKTIVAQKALRKILVEVKSFEARSLIYAFHAAVGQYFSYLGALKDENIDKELFLGISDLTYYELNRKSFYVNRIKDNKIKLLIVDLETEKIIKWIK